ncbi:MAG: UDP-2,3-diacylglucosamine diphosphatase [candidate division KSB1 bacterium]|jgi:UDP-2,3-diacylglucosamine hydrolase|nr:UDP-2,3-diacylglucosamine diphosphatase [candidate division KSB1 bacterium]
MEKVYFISDIHLGAETETTREHKFSMLNSFFDEINKKGNSLFIVGDLFDFWFEYKYYIPKKHYHIFFRLSKLIENGVNIHFLPGNHDFWTADFFQNEIGIKVHSETYSAEMQSKKVFLFHGDGISKKDAGYRFLKKITRNPINIFLFRLIHPDLGATIADKASHTSRAYTSSKELDDEADYLEFAKRKFEEGYDYVITGHSHRPEIESVAGKTMINLGDWINHFSYGVLSGGELSLKFWNKETKDS